MLKIFASDCAGVDKIPPDSAVAELLVGVSADFWRQIFFYLFHAEDVDWAKTCMVE